MACTVCVRFTVGKFTKKFEKKTTQTHRYKTQCTVFIQNLERKIKTLVHGAHKIENVNFISIRRLNDVSHRGLMKRKMI